MSNQLTPVYLIIKDHADPSAGLFPTEYKVQAPFWKEDIDSSGIGYFRVQQEILYSEYAQGKVTALYDFEIAELTKSDLL